MEPFRSTRGGGARASLAAQEASLLRSLVGQIVALVAPDGPPAAGYAGGSDGPDGPLARWEAELAADPPSTPDDPVLARLLPDGYRDDPEASQEFRKYTEASLRSAKHQAAQQMLDSLPEAAGKDGKIKIQLNHDQATAWLKALNDVRLALGVRLNVTEDFEGQWAGLQADDPQWAAYEVYAWLGAVQESLVQALA